MKPPLKDETIRTIFSYARVKKDHTKLELIENRQTIIIIVIVINVHIHTNITCLD